jgi:hypothetical protein
MSYIVSFETQNSVPPRFYVRWFVQGGWEGK